MKTNSGRVLELPKPEEGPSTQQELEQLSATYQATVRAALKTSIAEGVYHAKDVCHYRRLRDQINDCPSQDLGLLYTAIPCSYALRLRQAEPMPLSTRN